ncbi:hypothetical protein BHE90_000329 [Fusarium euwallaceae]|uniref:Uncharacterized protein n=2 Tax=Fusarium solani species complex TaxID=232080 RepID=A0A430MB34_9HYPO|nr:hypothetical protein CDV31_011099 [Fusarium ambrosium]RTE85175.1 hypothetical protein BHE90_000329 [Fusarium euwallaceae]
MGLEDLIPRALRDKRLQKVAFEAATTLAAESPVVKTIQAAYQITKVGDVVKNTNNLLLNASDTVRSAQTILPQMHIMGQSLVDTARLLSKFSMVATTLGMGANIIQTYQGIQALNLIAAKLGDMGKSLEAQTALTAQRDFPQYVYDMIRERLSQTAVDPDREHWFFLYHPDTDWYPKFFHLVEEKPLDPRFCGYTNQLDTVFMFMLAARERITERELRKGRKKQHCRPIQLHLIIPAYQSILIPESIRIPDEIGDFVIEGRINSNRPFVWLNLPEDQKYYTSDVGFWTPPPLGWWNQAMTWCGITEKPPEYGSPRILGMGPQPGLIEGEVETEERVITVEKEKAMIEEAPKENGITELVRRHSNESSLELVQATKKRSTPLHKRGKSRLTSRRRA